jgi:hypothetical protein
VGTALLPYAKGVEKIEIASLNFFASGLEGWTMLKEAIDGTTEREREAEQQTLQLAAAQDNAKRASRELSVEGRELADNLRDVSDRGGDVSREIDEMRRRLDNAADSAIGLDGAMDGLSDALFGSAVKADELAAAKQDLDDLLRDGEPTAAAQQRVFDLQQQMAQEAGPKAFRDWLLEQKRVLDDELNPSISASIDLLLKLNAAQIATSGGGKKASKPPGGKAPTAPASTSSVDIPHGALPTFAEGGTVPGPTGQAQLAVVHGGETVSPAGARGGLTVVFNSTWPPSPAQARELAQMIDRQLYYARPRAGLLPR